MDTNTLLSPSLSQITPEDSRLLQLDKLLLALARRLLRYRPAS